MGAQQQEALLKATRSRKRRKMMTTMLSLRPSDPSKRCKSRQRKRSKRRSSKLAMSNSRIRRR